MKTKSTLRLKFVKNILLIFACVLILLFFVFLLIFSSFFAKTIEELDVIENQLLAQRLTMKIKESKNVAESLSSNALLTDMLKYAKTTDQFNYDHNHKLIMESFNNAYSRIKDSGSGLWVYSVKNQYEIGEEGTAVPIKRDRDTHLELGFDKKIFEDTIAISHVDLKGTPLFEIISPIEKNGELLGFVGIYLDMKIILEEINSASALNNMTTNCTAIVPVVDKDMNIIGYNEYYLENGELKSIPVYMDFMNEFKDHVKNSTDRSTNEKGKTYISEAEGGWHVTSFVSTDTVYKAFFHNYISNGLLVYIIISLLVLLIVGLIAYRITRPLKELSNLIHDLNAGRQYEALKGNNEITNAADTIINFTEEHRKILVEIENLTGSINEGKLLMRLESIRNTGIKAALNKMLDGFVDILDSITVGILIVNKDLKIVYTNEYLRETFNISKEEFLDGLFLSDLDINDKEKIIAEIKTCLKTNELTKNNIYNMGRHLKLVTKKLNSDKNENSILQIFLNQTEVVEKIREQEQIFAYFEHLSIVKMEALSRLAKGDFKNAYLNIGKRPSTPNLQTIYDNQIVMQKAFTDTVQNIETIINEINDTTNDFANGNLHSFVDCESATGKYKQLVNTANNAFDVILKYFQYIPIPIRIIGRDFRVKFFNNASYQSGFRPGREVFCYNFYDSDKSCETCPIINNNKEISIREFSLEVKAQTRYFKVFRNPILDEDGEIAGMLEIRIDQTEVVNLKKEADSANMAKSVFIANMSHEIRTPMNAILGYSQLLQLSDNIDSTDLDYVNTIKQSGNHLLNLINDILEMSKIEAGKIQLNEEQFNLTDMFVIAKNMFKTQMESKGINFEVITDKNMPVYAVGDSMKIRQMLLNVISNAYKFTNSGSITVKASYQEYSKEEFKLVVDISDTGMGINKEEWDKVFRAFEQTESGYNAGGGTGLGMSISKNFARMMEGDLFIVDSQIGKGTTFRIEILLKNSTEGSQSEMPCKKYSCIKGINKPHTILIADDSFDNKEILNKIFTKVGFDVEICSTKKEIIEIFTDSMPDIVISESHMDDYDVVEEIIRLRKNEKNTHTPVIILSANALESDKQKALKAGADVFLTKPFVIEELMKVIEELTDIEYEFCEEEFMDDDEVAIANISDEIKNNIKDFILIGDFDSVIHIAENINEVNPKFAYKLIEYSDNFDKKAIQNLLDNNGEEH